MAGETWHDAYPSGEPERSPASPRGPVEPLAAPSALNLEGLTIDRAGEVPIGVQLAWSLRARIGDGRLVAGQRLPGLRELAEMLGINANTARSVYQRLEQEGLIESRQGTGTFVANISVEPSPASRIAADAAELAHRTGVDPREVAAALYVAGSTSEGTDAPAVRAGERRRELRAQIAALEQALSELQARHPGLIPGPEEVVRQAGPRLLSVRELERVRTGLARRLAAAESLPETGAGSARARATASARTQADRSRAAEAKEAKPVGRKTPRPRPRTRPSTA